MSSERIPGHATAEGTARFRDRLAGRLPGHFREVRGLWLSSIGLGTYLGEPDSATDALYHAAISRAIELGVNVIDSAINYRHQRSERTIGATLRDLIQTGRLQRDEVFVCTKGGFLSFDGQEPADANRYFYERFVSTGLVKAEDVAAGCHVMSPAYLAHQIEASRHNLGLDVIDLYYLHNPETQLSRGTRADFYGRVSAAFEALEAAVAQGKIHAYGTATWNGYRVSPEATDSISLSEILKIAEEVGGPAHHFRAVQLPFNLAMLEALDPKIQTMDGEPAPALVAARSRGLMVFASASLLQGRLTEGLPPDIVAHLPGLETDAQRAIQFVRSTPGITSALVGMSNVEHVKENLGAASAAPMSFTDYRAMFAGDKSN